MSDSTATAAREFVLGDHARATILTTAAETEGRHDVTYVVEPAGAMTPLHIHTRYAERLWVQSGSLTVWAGPDVRTLRAGDFFTIEMHVPHAIQVGADGVRGLNVSSPAGFAELIARVGTPAHLASAETELDMERFAAVAAELGDVILGPPGTTPTADQTGS